MDRAGALGQQTGLLAGPDFVSDGTVTFRQGGFRATLQTRYIQGGRYDTTLIGPDQPGFSPTLPNSVNVNHVNGRVYHNLSASYRFTSSVGRVEVYGVVNNLLDKDPPATVSPTAPTSPAYFDTLGRAYRASVRLEY